MALLNNFSFNLVFFPPQDLGYRAAYFSPRRRPICIGFDVSGKLLGLILMFQGKSLFANVLHSMKSSWKNNAQWIWLGKLLQKRCSLSIKKNDVFSWRTKRVGKMEKTGFGCKTTCSVCPVGEVHMQARMRAAAEKKSWFPSNKFRMQPAELAALLLCSLAVPCARFCIPCERRSWLLLCLLTLCGHLRSTGSTGRI